MLRIRRAAAVGMLLALPASAAAVGPSSPATTSADAAASDVALLLAYVLLALVFSFLCSVAEAVLLSVTPSYIAGLGQTRPRHAALLKRLKQDNVDQSLAAILTLNTIAHTVGAIGAGAKATAVFGSAWFGLFSAVMTLAILFLSEIVPKTLGAVFWKQLAGPTAVFLRGLIVILYPLIKVSEGLTRVIARRKNVHVPGRDELIAMAQIGAQGGQIGERESRIIRNLLRLDSLTAADIMTPRTVVVALPASMTVAEALEANARPPFSRLPVYGAGLDDVTGFVLKDDLLLYQAQERGQVELETLRREIATVTGGTPLSGVLEFLLDGRRHIALVLDEFGGTMGLVTLEDVVETLLGMEIVDEMDRVEDMQALARRQWEKRARALGLKVEAGSPAGEHTERK